MGATSTRFDANSAEFVPHTTWSGDDVMQHQGREGYHGRGYSGGFYTESGPGLYGSNVGYVTRDMAAGSFYGDPRGHHAQYDVRLEPEQIYAQYSPRDSAPRGNVRGGHRRGSSANEERGVLARTRIQDFVGRIPELCRDQNGCRHLQAQLDKNRDDALEIIFNGALPCFPDLMSDPFGNYLCQKLFEVCNDTQRTQLVKVVAPTMVTISLNQHGTRAVQKLLEFLTVPEQIEIVIEALKPDVVMLTKDLNGNHVIQKCLNKLSEDENQVHASRTLLT
jgi:Pumilio-family RNA binding repeat